MTLALIRQYHANGDLKSLETLFSALTEQRDRSEALARAYLHEIKVLAQRFAAVTEPASGRRASATEPTKREQRTESSPSKAKPTTTKPNIGSLEF